MNEFWFVKKRNLSKHINLISELCHFMPLHPSTELKQLVLCIYASSENLAAFQKLSHFQKTESRCYNVEHSDPCGRICHR